MSLPSLSDFVLLGKRHNTVPVSLELLGDEWTPLGLLHSSYSTSKTCFLLESVEGGEHLARYSFASFSTAAE